MIKPEKFGYLQLVYHFTVPLNIYDESFCGNSYGRKPL